MLILAYTRHGQWLDFKTMKGSVLMKSMVEKWVRI